MSLKVMPPSVLTCHCTLGLGVPLALTLKVTDPGHTVCELGSSATTGSLLRLSVAAVLATFAPQTLLNRAYTTLSRSAATALKVKLRPVAPGMSLKVMPPSVLTCHCTLGLGVPLALALKV